MAQINKPGGAHCAPLAQRVARDGLVRRGYRVKGSILAGGGPVPFQRQLGQEPARHGFIRQRGGHLGQRRHETVPVAVLGGQGFVLCGGVRAAQVDEAVGRATRLNQRFDGGGAYKVRATSAPSPPRAGGAAGLKGRRRLSAFERKQPA
jgi:hypothetical protein